MFWFMFFDSMKPLYLGRLRAFYVFWPVYKDFGAGCSETP